MRKLLFTIAAGLGLVACGTANENTVAGGKVMKERNISRDAFGKSWPLAVTEGTLKCIQFGETEYTKGVVFESEGKTYGINGVAKTYGKDDFNDIGEIWLDDPSIPGAKMAIAPILNTGLELCK